MIYFVLARSIGRLWAQIRALSIFARISLFWAVHWPYQSFRSIFQNPADMIIPINLQHFYKVENNACAKW